MSTPITLKIELNVGGAVFQYESLEGFHLHNMSPAEMVSEAMALVENIAEKGNPPPIPTIQPVYRHPSYSGMSDASSSFIPPAALRSVDFDVEEFEDDFGEGEFEDDDSGEGGATAGSTVVNRVSPIRPVQP